MTKLIALAIVTMISCSSSSRALANEEKGATAPATGTVEQTNTVAPTEGKSEAQQAKKAGKHKNKKPKQ